MSTLRTDTLKTTDDLTTIAVADIASNASVAQVTTDLANFSDPTKGANKVGRSVIALASIPALLAINEASDLAQDYHTTCYHPSQTALSSNLLGSGSNTYRWDAARSKTEHDGGMIIDPDRVFPSDWTNSTQLTAWFTAAVSGTGCWVAIRESTGVHVNCYGAVPDDETYAVANYQAIRAAIKFAIRFNGPGTGMFRLECQEEVQFGSGNYFVQGNSLFCFSRTELEALPGNYRFRRGIKYQGQGRDGTILTLKNTGAHTWFYNTADPNFPGDTSVMDQVEFNGITFRSYDFNNKFVVTENSKISGFRMETYGWEKFFVFDKCRFEGLDRGIQYSGNGNADHNTFYSCQFVGIKDSVFFINNNQSVQTRLYGCDMENIYGNCFDVFTNGGGDVHMYGGSIILQPRYLATNLPDLASTAIRAFLNVFQDSGAGGLGFGNNIFDFNGLRFEMYDDFQKLVYALKDTAAVGGSIDVRFTQCNWHTDMNRDAADAVITPAAATKSAIVFNNNLRCDTTLTSCQLIKRHLYSIISSTSPFAPSRIMFDKCILEWDPAADTADGGLITKCSATTNGSYTARGTMSIGNIGAGDERTRVVLDFQKGIESASGGLAFHTVTAQVKSLAVKWPIPSDTKPRVYLPPGAIVTEVTINKPAFTPSGTPATNYGLVLQDAAAATIHATSTGSEERAIVTHTALATPKVIGAAPNNFVQLTAVGTGLTQTQSFAGTITVQYQ